MKIKNKKIAIILTVLMASSMVVACSNKDSKDTKQNTTKSEQKVSATTKDDYTYENNEYFTSIAWLEKHINDKNLVLIDARSDKQYKEGHIPGAINLAWQSLAKMQGKAGDKDWGTLLDATKLSEALQKVGINKDSVVIVYSNKDGWGEDGRVVWCLKEAGIDARMLNGGYNLWESEGKKVSKDSISPEKGNVVVEKINNDMNITTDELKQNIDKVKIIDTRESDEYKGATKFGEKRGGHLPNSINIAFNKFYNEDGTIKSSKEIEKIMTENNIKKTDEIVTYCTAGIRSAHMDLALKNAGYENVKNYDASYYEWAADENNKLEK